LANIKEILALKEELQTRDAARDASYDEYLPLVLGSTYDDVRRLGYNKGAEAATDYLFKARETDEDAEVQTAINLIKPAIENKISYLSLPLTVQVIEPPDELAPETQLPAVPSQAPGLSPGTPESAPGPLPGAWAVDFADREEQAIQALLKMSNMERRSRDLAWCLCAMGGGVIGAWPDLRKNLPRIFTRVPQHFHPVPYDVDGLELKQALWVDKMTGREIAARYGTDRYIRSEDEVEVTSYIDENTFCVEAGGKFLTDPVENKAGVVPIVCVGNLGIPGIVFGDMEFKDAIPVMREINYQMYLVDKMAGAMVNPTIAVKEGRDVPRDIAIGQGGLIEMGANGSVELLGPINLPNAWWQLGAVLQNWFDLISDNPAVLRGEGGGSIITGKGFNAQLGPIAARMQAKLNILMRAWEQAIRYMLLMWDKFPGMKSVRGTGVRDKMPYFIEAKPKEFHINGEMWTEVVVSLSAQSFIDRQGNDVEVMQLYQNELLSWDTSQENLPYVANKKRERVRIERDRIWKAEGMAIANQAANSPMTANTDIGAQERTAYGLERGFMGEAPPPPMPTGEVPAEGMPAEGAAPEGEDLVTVLTDVFAGISKLKGRVWFGGDPLINPAECTDDNPDWTVTVWVEDPQDKGTITRAAEKIPELYGRIDFVEGEPSPDEPSVPVGGGAVEAPMGEEELPPGMELPPEMMGGMGG
jgi:hypothetical protein